MHQKHTACHRPITQGLAPCLAVVQSCSPRAFQATPGLFLRLMPSADCTSNTCNRAPPPEPRPLRSRQMRCTARRGAGGPVRQRTPPPPAAHRPRSPPPGRAAAGTPRAGPAEGLAEFTAGLCLRAGAAAGKSCTAGRRINSMTRVPIRGLLESATAGKGLRAIGRA